MKRVTKMDIIINNNFQNIRKQYEFSQEKTAKMLGVTRQQVQKYESCIDRIPATTLFKASIIFDTDINYFFEGIEYVR